MEIAWAGLTRLEGSNPSLSALRVRRPSGSDSWGPWTPESEVATTTQLGQSLETVVAELIRAAAAAPSAPR